VGLAPSANQAPDFIEQPRRVLVATAIEVVKVRRHPQRKAQFVYTQIRARKVRFSVPCEGGFDKKFQNVQSEIDDTIPEHELLALGKSFNRGNEP